MNACVEAENAFKSTWQSMVSGVAASLLVQCTNRTISMFDLSKHSKHMIHTHHWFDNS